MDFSFLFVQALNGAASAASLFMAAAGLTLVFGVTRIVNFAHGSFYMLGAYFAVSIIPRLIAATPTLWAFLAGAALAAACVGVVGVAMELLILRRIYAAPELLHKREGTAGFLEGPMRAPWGWRVSLVRGDEL